MKRRTVLSFWPSFLHPVFLAVGTAMDGKQLHPDILKKMPKGDFSSIDQHSTRIEHVSGEAARPGGNRYEITIAGPRINGKWGFFSGELADLAREAVSGQGVRPEDASSQA